VREAPGRRDHEPPSPEPEVVDHVLAADAGELQHLLHDHPGRGNVGTAILSFSSAPCAKAGAASGSPHDRNAAESEFILLPSLSSKPCRAKHHRLPAHSLPAAPETPGDALHRAPFPAPGKTHRADGFLRRAALGPGDAGHGRPRLARGCERAPRPPFPSRFSRLTAPCARESGAHAEAALFGFVGVGHEAAVDTLGVPDPEVTAWAIQPPVQDSAVRAFQFCDFSTGRRLRLAKVLSVSRAISRGRVSTTAMRSSIERRDGVGRTSRPAHLFIARSI